MCRSGADPGGVDWVSSHPPYGFEMPTKQLKISHESFAQRLCTLYLHLASRVLESA